VKTGPMKQDNPRCCAACGKHKVVQTKHALQVAKGYVITTCQAVECWDCGAVTGYSRVDPTIPWYCKDTGKQPLMMVRARIILATKQKQQEKGK